jgi:hypothetical protein
VHIKAISTEEIALEWEFSGPDGGIITGSYQTGYSNARAEDSYI